MISGTGSVSGSFNILANCSFTKLGLGLFSISAPQTNGVGSNLNVQAGNFSMFTDAGSTSSRTLTINSSANTFLGFNEHLAALNVGNGTTTVGQNGSRVLVTSALSTGSEGGALDMRDNDLILDYSGATPL